MSRQQHPGRTQASPSFSGSLPGFPDAPAELIEDDSLPLPDHFPEPYVDPDLDPKDDPRSSAVLEKGETLVYCSTEYAVNHSKAEGQRDSDVFNEVKEGLRRITDKYAAPGSLLRNSSVSSSASHTLTVSAKDTLPASPTPSITLSPSPTPSISRDSGDHSSVSSSQCAMNSSGRLSVASDRTSQALPDLNSLSQAITRKQGGSVHGLSPMSVSTVSDVSSSDVPSTSSSPAPMDGFRGGPVGVSPLQSVSGLGLTASLGEGVTEQDVQQVEMFYRSHKSEVTVCHCLANLYIGSHSSPTSPSSVPNGEVPAPANGGDLWEFVTTGIPLLVLDSGDHLRARQVTLVVAEKGTGFVLWRDTVSPASHYSCPHDNFHTVTLSTDTAKLAGLSFDDGQAADDFASTVKQLTADPEDDEKGSGKKGKKKKKQESKKKPKYKPPKKMDISQPCCFQHITKLERPQITGVLPLPPNSFRPPPSSSVSSLSDAFHDHLAVPLTLARTSSQSSQLSEVSTAVSEH